MAPNENSTSAAVQNGYHKRTSRIFPETDEDDIVVSGISGRFPNSRSISEYEYNLYNKVQFSIISGLNILNLEYNKNFGLFE